MKLPPYGKMGEGYWKAMAADKLPQDWLAGDPERDQKWNEWLLAMRKIIADHIWPAYDVETNGWVGEAANFADELTDAEISLMMRAFQIEPNAFLQRLPTSPRLSPTAHTHIHYFLAEDGLRPFGADYGEYDSALPSWLSGSVASLMREGLKRKVGSGILFLKSEFVRTRPYQASMILGHPGFRNETAATSLTSSIFSGHALQGLITASMVFSTWSEFGLSQDEEAVACLSQFAVDIGDRRVFAGVHFPSDNVASWIIALNMADFVFNDSDSIKSFIREAITKRSAVFHALDDSAKSTSALAKPMEALRAALGS